MIKFVKIRYKNLLSSGNVFTEIDFMKHKQTLIVGKNGAGKSTIIDALFFALYGSTYKKLLKAQIINSINKKAALVELDLIIGSDEYMIRRGIKPDVFEIYKNGSLINQDGSVREYQEMFETTIFRMNEKSFRQIIVIGKTGYAPFMTLDAAKRREFIENLLDIEVFTTMKDILKVEVKDTVTKLSTVEKDLTLTKERIKLHEEHVVKLQKNKDEDIKIIHNNIHECELIISGLDKSVEKLQARIEEKQTEVVDDTKIKNTINEMRDIDTQLKTKLKRLKTEVEFYEENTTCPTCKQGIHEEFKCELIDKNTASIDKIEENLGVLAKKYQSAQDKYSAAVAVLNDISSINQEIQSLNRDISMNNRLISNYRQQIAKIENTVDETVESNIVDIQTELKKHENTKKDLTDRKNMDDLITILLKDNGIKARMIKRYIPKINAEINKYLSTMDLFVQFEINENFEETIKSRHRDTFSYNSFSEGEKQRIDLALLFTWRAISKSRTGSTTNLLFFDETLDGSLDETGINDFIRILNDLTSDTNTFIISHNTDTIEKFDNVIRFEKIRNFSQIV